MQQIINCRTRVLGGHRQACRRCGFTRYCYHSCRNRHCPKCQTDAKEAWRVARQSELLNVPYFHNVFTLPHEFNELILRSESNQRRLLKLLFDATAETLLEFGRRELRGQVGFTLVLHTWDQQLRPHFHLHCLIAAGALAKDHSQWIAGGRQFLFPVRALSVMFRAKFLAGVRLLLAEDQLKVVGPWDSAEKQRQLIRKLFRKSWVVYSQAPFAGPAKLLDYLSRYTHRVAITNSRLIRCRDGKVTFSFRDRRDGDRRKTMVLPAEQFIGRFLRHVLPSRFARIRHYGYLANRFKQVRLTLIRKLIGASAPSQVLIRSPAKWLIQELGIVEDQCPCCGDTLRQTPLANLLSAELLRPSSLEFSIASRGPPG